jgi:Arabinose-binding domain of AraC transcription regulator, N-term
MPEANFSIAIVRDIVQYVAAQGVDVNCLYNATDIDSAWLDDPDRQVSGEVLQKLWREAVQQTGDWAKPTLRDRNLGLHIGEAFDLSAIGIVGYVLLNWLCNLSPILFLVLVKGCDGQSLVCDHRLLETL